MPVFNATEFQRIVTFVRERRDACAKEAAIGRPKTWDAYQHLIGQIKALDDVERQMVEITGSPEATDEKDV